MKVDKLITKFNINDQNKIFNLIIKIIEGKKEVLDLREKEKK
jgi:hypothetical protein